MAASPRQTPGRPVRSTVVWAKPHFTLSRGHFRLPDLTVPLATYTGWNLRHPQMGASDQLMSLMGSTIPFPATRIDRESLGDRRLSISERYPTKTEYLAQARREAQRLVESGHMLAEDLELVVDQASRRYEILLEHTLESLTASNIISEN